MKQILSLNGTWRLSQIGGEIKLKKTLAGTVPGDVFKDLLDKAVIPDPFYRANEDELKWVGAADWRYGRSFTITPEFLENDRVLLTCDGLDTLAEIRVNGKRVAKTENMFRTWEFEVRKFLVVGKNSIEIDFMSATKYIAERVAKDGPMRSWGGPKEEKNRAWIRKEPCNFGWDWGPVLVTAGIWREISLVGYATARIEDVHLTQSHEDGSVVLNAALAVKSFVGKAKGLILEVRVAFDGKTVAENTVSVRGKCVVNLAIPKPQLWWPNGLGAQPLYDVEIVLKDAQGTIMDSTTRRIGLRTLHLDRHADAWGESFQFVVNGVAFFAKGANWIPADAILSRVTKHDYRRLVGDAKAVNMNMLRAWGGGIYEDDEFYTACDEAGICVWQDFMFACSGYPFQDQKYLENLRGEFIDNIKRIRHHACIALWCGNNELECGLVGPKEKNPMITWDLYKIVFDEMLPSLLAELDPEREYWPCSPHSPTGDRADHGNPTCGDAHLWSVWHGRQPFEWYRTCQHRFNSEFGFQSFPEPRTLESFTLPEDRNVTAPVMEHHQRSGAGNGLIMTYMLDWFRMPNAFNMQVRLSQILQGMAMKYACEHWRRQMPRGMGTLYWQLNDNWPAPSWSSIDYFGRWKAAHYMARRFFAPVLVSCVEDIDTRRVELHVTSDEGEVKSGAIHWSVFGADGKRMATGEIDGVIIPSRADSIAATLDLADLVARLPEGLAGMLLTVELTLDGKVVSDNFATFVRPKSLNLLKPSFCCEVSKIRKGEFKVVLHVDAPALWTWLEIPGLDVTFSDNYLHIMPDKPVVITITDKSSRLTPAKVAAELVVKSLYDTYQEK